jgi:5-methylcytosine-specific restriction endonuclease McrA
MNEAVLVLNSNFEPINICDYRRAIGLIITDKAHLVINGRGYIYTSNNKYPRPSIIRLHKIVHRPRPKVKFNRREIFRRDNFTCQYCGKHTPQLTVDHIIARHSGGENSWQNVVAACYACNHRKGGRTLEETSMHLLHPPKEPPSSAMYIFGRKLVEYNEWEPYLTGW